MEITRNDIVGEDFNKRIWILDFTLTDAEAVATQSIATILAAEVATLQPPFGAILALLLVAEAGSIHAANSNGRGAGANVHFQVFPPAVPPIAGFIKHVYFSL